MKSSEGERSSHIIHNIRNNPGVLLYLNDPEDILRDIKRRR
jgi:hypothetical protein